MFACLQFLDIVTRIEFVEDGKFVQVEGVELFHLEPGLHAVEEV